MQITKLMFNPLEKSIFPPSLFPSTSSSLSSSPPTHQLHTPPAEPPLLRQPMLNSFQMLLQLKQLSASMHGLPHAALLNSQAANPRNAGLVKQGSPANQVPSVNQTLDVNHALSNHVPNVNHALNIGHNLSADVSHASSTTLNHTSANPTPNVAQQPAANFLNPLKSTPTTSAALAMGSEQVRLLQSWSLMNLARMAMNSNELAKNNKSSSSTSPSLSRQNSSEPDSVQLRVGSRVLWLRRTEDTTALEASKHANSPDILVYSVTTTSQTAYHTVTYNGGDVISCGEHVNRTENERDANLKTGADQRCQAIKLIEPGDELLLLLEEQPADSETSSEHTIASGAEDTNFAATHTKISGKKILLNFEDTLNPPELPSEQGYQCHRCGKMFSYAYYRNKHLKYTRCVDNGDRKFPCSMCNRSFEKRDRLRIHVLHVHENHRPHVCTVCGKAFSQSSSLNKHLRVHSGERPYQCPYCTKCFTASSILRTHIRQHSGEKPFKCAHCGKSFASHAAHDSHVRRTHQPAAAASAAASATSAAAIHPQLRCAQPPPPSLSLHRQCTE